MACKCGSQIVLCNLPIRFDTYVGCSHGCRYCFVQKKNGQLEAVKKGDTVESLKAFVQGKRSGETAWCDWNIPIHWGGMSDPFQPVEKKCGYSLECLKYLAETKYPFVVSTKGRLAASPEYLELLAECNCVVQISMVCSRYDQLEKGAPSYEERLEMLRTISPKVKRTIVRIQPFMHEVLQDVLKNLPRVKAAGAHGCGLVFYSGENRLRNMGDDMTCCGIEGLDGFKPNTYNLCMMINGKNPQPTERMKQVGTADAFKTLNQTAGSGQKISKQSLAGIMQNELAQKADYYRKIFGKAGHE